MNYFLVDYHVHTDNSFDSKVKMFDYCQRAVEIGIKEIVFTEHFDLNPQDPGFNLFDYNKYCQEIEKCRRFFGDKLVIKKGLELGEPHLYFAEHTAFLKNKDFDFLIGSVHYIGNTVLHGDYGLLKEREVYLKYFEEVFQTAKTGEFHVLGHLDVLKRYVPQHFKKFRALDYEEIIREILKILVRRGKGIEINTSGFRQGLGETLPTIEVLKWFRELGGEIVTIGSDAHYLNHLGKNLKEGIELVKEAGFKGISIFTKGELEIINFIY